MFTWNESFMVGEPAIDLQHKLLIETFNELESAIEDHKAHAEIKKILIFLKHYADWHFCREELCAEQLNCPVSEDNKRAHKKFSEVFNGLYNEYLVSPSEAVAHRTHNELSNWIIGHVLKIDAQIGICYKKTSAYDKTSGLTE